MKKDFSAARLDVQGFAAAQATLTGQEPLATFERLAAGSADPRSAQTVQWQAHGEERRAGVAGDPVPWLHLTVQAPVVLTCQRCLSPVTVSLEVDRWFRFAADEATAAAEDEEAEEDVLVMGHDFDLLALIEDELLMSLPVSPRHESCPQPLLLSAVDPGFETASKEAAQPFAVLESLRSRKAEED